jgi:dipeptide/tripeptide permease
MLGAAAALTAFLLLPWGYSAVLAAAAYGFCFSAVVSYGPWIAELYPPHLRSSATSIFQWGRFISLFSPLVTGALAGLVGLAAAMGLAAMLFLIAAWIWLRLPETLESSS